jgi:hypothetical protein
MAMELLKYKLNHNRNIELLPWRDIAEIAEDISIL